MHRNKTEKNSNNNGFLWEVGLWVVRCVYMFLTGFSSRPCWTLTTFMINKRDEETIKVTGRCILHGSGFHEWFPVFPPDPPSEPPTIAQSPSQVPPCPSPHPRLVSLCKIPAQKGGQKDNKRYFLLFQGPHQHLYRDRMRDEGERRKWVCLFLLALPLDFKNKL